jgi:hypothetical protein
MNAIVSPYSLYSFSTLEIAPAEPVDEETNPHVQLLEGLGFVMLEAGCLTNACQDAMPLMKVLDQAPRHNTDLVDVKWRDTVDTIIGADRRVLAKAQLELRQSIEAIELARRAVYGQFRGEQKVKTEDAVTRHLTEAKQLLATFEEIETTQQAPYQPYQVRQKCLSQILLQIGVLLDLVIPLRRQFNVEQFPDGLFNKLMEQETALFRLRAKVAKWRDNPSQKLGAKFAVCLEQTTAIQTGFAQLKNAARTECSRQGIHFYRRGRIAQ